MRHGEHPEATLQHSEAPGATEERRWLCRVRDLDYVFNHLHALRDSSFSLAAAVLLCCELGLRLRRRAGCVGGQLVLRKRGWRENP